MSFGAFVIILALVLWVVMRLQLRYDARRALARRQAELAPWPESKFNQLAESLVVTQDAVAERFNISRELLEEFEPERMPCPKTQEPHDWSGPIVVNEPEEVTVYTGGPGGPGTYTIRSYRGGWAIKECSGCGIQETVPCPKPEPYAKSVKFQ